MIWRRGPTWEAVALWSVLGACGGEPDTLPVGPEEPDTVVSSIRVSPSERTLGILGTRFEIGASALTKDDEVLYGSTAHPGRFSWSSSAPDVATVDPEVCATDRRCYVVTSVSEGTATVTAESQGLTGDMTVTVHDRARLAWSVPTGLVVADIAIGADGTIYAGASDYPTHRSLWHALSPDGGIVWTLDLPLTGRSAPAISSDGTLYLGSWSDHGFSGSLVAVGPGGTVRWVLDGLKAIWSSPAIGPDGTIYVAGGRYVYAVDPQGTIQWTYEADDDVFAFSSPAIASDGTIDVGGYDARLHAVNADGSTRWTFETGDIIQSSPAIGTDGTIYFGSEDGRLYAVHPDGMERWNVEVDVRGVESSPSFGPDGTIYVGGGGVFAVDPGGSIRWSFQGSTVVNTPTLGADGNVYFATGGGVAALDAQGRLLWDFTASGSSSPAISIDGRIIATSFTEEGGGSVLAIAETSSTNGGYAGSPWPTGRGDQNNSGRAGG